MKALGVHHISLLHRECAHASRKNCVCTLIRRVTFGILLILVLVSGHLLFFSNLNTQTILNIHHYESKAEGKQPKLYIKSFGRLGNKLCQIAALYGLAQSVNRTPVLAHYLFTGLLNETLEAFPHIQDKIRIENFVPNGTTYISTIPNNPNNIKYFFSTILSTKENVEIEHHFLNTWAWLKYKGAVFSMMKFSSAIERRSGEVIHNIYAIEKLDSPDVDIVFIGIHVRRGDKIHKVWINLLPKQHYFMSAMNYTRKKYYPEKTVFLISSDSMDWCKEQFSFLPNVHFLNGSAIVDMATLTKCNHTVLSEGTYSRWVGMFTKGTVYCHTPRCTSFGLSRRKYHPL